MKVSILSWFALAMSSAHAAPAVDPTALLKDADRARGGLEKGVVWTIAIENRDEASSSTRGFEVQAKADDAIAKAVSPARNKGEVFLFNDRMMWFYKPGLRKPVGISARQKLTGEAANGDIASTQYARDYEAKLVGEEKIGNKATYLLDLKAKKKNVTYDRIRYWVSKEDHLGVQAEFQSLEGIALKKATFTYDNKLKVEAKEYPFVSAMVISDAKDPRKQSTIQYGKPSVKDLSSSLFNVNRLIQ